MFLLKDTTQWRRWGSSTLPLCSHTKQKCRDRCLDWDPKQTSCLRVHRNFLFVMLYNCQAVLARTLHKVLVPRFWLPVATIMYNWQLYFYTLVKIWHSMHPIKLICMSRDMRFPTMWYVWPAKAQTSLRIRADWSEPLLVAWIFHEYQATDQTAFGVSKLKRRLYKLIWVYTCQNTTLLEITCRGSYGKSL